MSRIKFNAEVDALQEQGIDLAKADQPNFDLARETLSQAGAIAVKSFDNFRADLFTARNTNDLGVVDVREGLYNRSHNGATTNETLSYVTEGIDKIDFSYDSLLQVLANIYEDRLRDREQRSMVRATSGHLAATMNTRYRATQTSQILAGEIGPDKKASKETLDAQWMIGKGTLVELGASVYAIAGDNGYWAAQTHLLALRGGRINGGSKQLLSGIGSGLTLIPEMLSRTVTDPKNVKQMLLTTLRLSLESRTRESAMAAALDYQHF